VENDLVKAKKDNLRKLKGKGIFPYPYKFSPTAYSSDLQSKYSSLKNEESGPEFSVAGRVMVQRSFGAIAFIKLMDSKGTIQLFFRKGVSSPAAFDLLAMVDMGDFVGAKGKVYRTQRGELSILVDSLEMLSKSILPLPEKFHGLQDIEIRQNQWPQGMWLHRLVLIHVTARSQFAVIVLPFKADWHGHSCSDAVSSRC